MISYQETKVYVNYSKTPLLHFLLPINEITKTLTDADIYIFNYYLKTRKRNCFPSMTQYMMYELFSKFKTILSKYRRRNLTLCIFQIKAFCKTLFIFQLKVAKIFQQQKEMNCCCVYQRCV